MTMSTLNKIFATHAQLKPIIPSVSLFEETHQKWIGPLQQCMNFVQECRQELEKNEHRSSITKGHGARTSLCISLKIKHWETLLDFHHSIMSKMLEQCQDVNTLTMVYYIKKKQSPTLFKFNETHKKHYIELVKLMRFYRRYERITMNLFHWIVWMQKELKDIHRKIFQRYN